MFEVIYLGNNIDRNKEDSVVSKVGWAENSEYFKGVIPVFLLKHPS